MALEDNDGDILKTLDQVANAGKVALNHIGWALSVVFTFLVGLYVLVIGGQVLHQSPDDEARLRHRLGRLAVLTAGAMFPALFTILVYCARDSEAQGAILAIIPTAVLMVVLSTHLGQFTLTKGAVLADVKRKKASLEKARGRLPITRRRRVWEPIVVTVAIGTLMPLLVELCLSMSQEGAWRPSEWIGALVTIVIVTPLYVALSFYAMFQHATATDVWEKAVSVLQQVVCFLVLLAVVLILAADYGPGTLLQSVPWAAFVLFSTYAPLWPDGWSEWTLRAASVNLAYRRLGRSLCRASRRLDNATPGGDSA